MLLDDFIKHSLEMSDFTSENTTHFSGSQKYETYQNINVENVDKVIDIDENMTSKEINEEIDRIIDKGVKNLTDNDKKMLEKLSNLK